MNYVADTLGVKVNTKTWLGAKKLPYYLIDRYDFKKVMLDEVECLFMKPKGELDTLTAVKKHILKVRETEALPVVLDIKGMTARRRDSLIKAHIPFVAPQCHIYLPFMGIALSERYASIKLISETLMPSSQLLFFHYLYQHETELYTAEAIDILSVSAMQITRAVRQLSELGLVSTKKDGVRTVLFSNEKKRDLFERAKPHLLNPVRKKVYTEHTKLSDKFPMSGYTALSKFTMLGSSELRTFAFYGRGDVLAATDILIDTMAQAEIEIWHYEPTLLSKNPKVVDVLSLIASLEVNDDVRTEQAIDELLSNLWR